MINKNDARLQQIKGNDKPLAGKHTLFVGDLFQLRPVAGAWIFQNPKSGLGALCSSDSNLFQKNFKMYELTEIMRQKDDKTWAELLNRLREDNLYPSDITLLKTRLISPNDAHYPYDAPHAFPLREEVRQYNNLIYEKLNAEKLK